MSTNINIPVLKPCVFYMNLGVNYLTRQYAAKVENDQRVAVFHYDVKVVIFNASAVTALGITGESYLRGKLSILGVIGLFATLFTCAVTDRSMALNQDSFMGWGVSIWKGYIRNDPNEKKVADVFTESLKYLGSARITSLANDSAWKENLIEIQGFPILKNWAVL